jgi:HPt (histidine-containing phosphotransfer) domain-containing protein
MTESRQRSALLHARYAQSFASKHAKLAAAWRAFAEAAGAANRDELRQQVHRLAGSAPAYGYAGLGSLARDIDRQFAEWDRARSDLRCNPADFARHLAAPVQALLDCLAAHAANPSAPPR